MWLWEADALLGGSQRAEDPGTAGDHPWPPHSSAPQTRLWCAAPSQPSHHSWHTLVCAEAQLCFLNIPWFRGHLLRTGAEHSGTTHWLS